MSLCPSATTEQTNSEYERSNQEPRKFGGELNEPEVVLESSQLFKIRAQHGLPERRG